MRKYVCAFRGRRDSYQAAIALEEQGLLEKLVTDFYSFKWMTSLGSMLPNPMAERLNSRRSDQIAEHRVKALNRVLLAERLYNLAGISQRVSFARTAGMLSHAAADQARKTKSNLLLYHSYAWAAFTATYRHSPRKVLFQYHPHYDFENSLYIRDAADFPEFAEDHRTYKTEGIPPTLWEKLTGAWRHSDLIICASSFTKQSLLWAGAEAAKCIVVPYGNDPLALPSQTLPDPNAFQVLFVGTGEPRKGLHHLLLAWQRLRCPFPKKLVLVCGDVSPKIRALIGGTPDIELRSNLTSAELADLYATSHLFAMPSLVEGFGLVYIEALSYGCPVLGTSNSGLPDLGNEADGIFLVRPGQIEELAQTLKSVSALSLTNRELRRSAKSCAVAHTWSHFRTALTAALSS